MSQQLILRLVVPLIVLGLGGCVGVQPPAVDAPSNDNAAPSDDKADDVPLHDPLSMPEQPTLSTADFGGADTCAACHPTHYAEWKTSMHAYAMIDPVYRALVGVRQADFDGARDQFCTQCHSAIGTRGGDIVAGFSFDDLQPITLEGVTCEACHRVSQLERIYNSGHEFDLTGPMRGTIEVPEPTMAHDSAYSPLHARSDFCGACHDVVEQHGLQLERAFDEWKESPAAADGRTCQTCHMPTYTGRASAVNGTPERENLHSHRFVGVDLPMADDFIEDPDDYQRLRADVIALLRSAGQITAEAPDSVQAGSQIDLWVTVQNLIDAHNLPTGSTFNRQLWLAVTATDATGAVLYATGDLDANGDLRGYFGELDQYGDDDLVTFGSGFIDAGGNPTLFPWRAVEHISSTLSPGYAKTVTYFVPTDAAIEGPVTIDVRLRFRRLSPFMLRALGLADFVERLEIIDIDQTTLTVELE